MSAGNIRIIGARQNNLKNLSLDLPLNELIVVSGVSGSGKSSLAFDTLYAEGQRRYVESFSAYARQFLERMDKPQVERIEGIPPAIAIDQSNPVKNSRSTVGTMTELTDHIRLLFAKIGQLHCRQCGRPVVRSNASDIVASLLQSYSGQSILISFPYQQPAQQELEAMRRDLQRLGFTRLLVAGQTVRLDADLPPLNADMAVEVLVDRVIVHTERRARLTDSLDQAMHFGHGLVIVHLPEGQLLKFSQHLHCPECDITYRDPVPNLFSFNSPLGACDGCHGFGRTIDIDLDLVIPDPRKSLRDGAIKPWNSPVTSYERRTLLEFCARQGIPTDVPYAQLSATHKSYIIDGHGSFEGIRDWFRWLETRTYRMHVRIFLARYRSYVTCTVCHGTRLKAEALLTRIRDKHVAEVYAMPVGATWAFFRELAAEYHHDRAIDLLLSEICSRLQYLVDVGLDYLTLDRQSRTLSGGEVQRVNLTTAIGSSLVNTLYILDEPSIGLHPRDSRRLVQILHNLKANQNTIVVVEHDPEIIRESDCILDLGPGAGERGGEVVYFGAPAGILREERSLTGQYLAGKRSIPVPTQRHQPHPDHTISILGACQNNLKDIDITIPLGLLVCVTGVSGSGKSTLVHEVLYNGLQKARGIAVGTPGTCRALRGGELVDEVVMVDQSPIGRTPRANPISYVKAYDPIRRLFAATPAAQARSFSASTFSFNAPGGRCESCQGSGFEKVEMQFLSDIFVLCPECEGARFRPEVLEVTYDGKTIAEVLQLTVAEALTFFRQMRAITEALRPLEEVGLDYIRLGQPLNTLSGGESQRLKLASHMSLQGGGRRLLIFDEPTTGLHFEDIRKLLGAFNRLLSQGHSLLVIEHNMEVIKSADYLIDLGPEGGEAGGYVMACGTPEAVSQCERSYTGQFLRRYLQGSAADAYPLARPHATPALPATNGHTITISGARQHNLKNIEVDIPRDQFVVVTGLSGSGKSTLAFDIVFAEGQRRYMESLSAYVRQFLQPFSKPEVDIVRGVPPTVAIEQRVTRGGGKSTVATVTEVYHYLRLLYAKIGVQHCPGCDLQITSQTAEQILGHLMSTYEGEQVTFLAPMVRGRKGFHKEVFAQAEKAALTHVRVDGDLVTLAERPGLDRYREHDIDFVIGTTLVSRRRQRAVQTLLERALYLGQGACSVLAPEHAEHLYSLKFFCPRCSLSFAELDPRLFSFNSRHGACPTCTGMGVAYDFDLDLLVPDAQLSLRQGTLAVYNGGPFKERHRERLLRSATAALRIDLETPFAALRQRQRQALLHGSSGRGGSFEGVLPHCRRLLETSSRESVKDYLAQFMNEVPCTDCHGTRLQPQARAVCIAGYSICDLVALAVDAAVDRVQHLALTTREQVIAEPVLKEIAARLQCMQEVGLGYLTLDRPSDTLSGGEAQRLRLAAQLGSNLRGVCYVLDEPTIGLHPRDNHRLLGTLGRLKVQGNSIVVVEHDEETIRRADYVIDLGPGAGRQGGQVVARGTPQQLAQHPASITGHYLSNGWHQRAVGRQRALEGRSWLTLDGAREHNLKHIEISFPLETFIAVTGVSGSGKSTLIKHTLYNALRKRLTGYNGRVGAYDGLRGAEAIRRVLEVDHTPIGKTPRSNPATYVGFYDDIRRLLTHTPEARLRGYAPGRFSFNVKGGRCESCAGQGQRKVEMNFLPDVFVPCEVCNGTRYTEDTLEITYNGKHAAAILAMTVSEALEFFDGVASIKRPLQILDNAGLGYLTLGQSSNTLSGGEAQRIKLAYELSRSAQPGTLYILDEPTTGLHLADIEKLLHVLQSLVDQGNTVVVIEHNLEVIRQADYIIDLGPEGGEAGGEVVIVGPPEHLMAHPEASYTARFLRQYCHGACV
ncbi:MAG TPA: excinuclease ABC subunit UvrA [Candidatus Tectomicrobia bacterium]|jgi:excinuclease ABC subunit A